MLAALSVFESGALRLDACVARVLAGAKIVLCQVLTSHDQSRPLSYAHQAFLVDYQLLLVRLRRHAMLPPGAKESCILLTVETEPLLMSALFRRLGLPEH